MIWLAANWRALVCAFGMASLALAAILARADARQCHKQDAQHVAALNLEVQKNAINLASIGELQAALAAKEADTAARANALNTSKVQNATAVATADARRVADKGRIDTLKQLAVTLPITSDCTAPAALLNNLKGL
jgi:hypothetical protein